MPVPKPDTDQGDVDPNPDNWGRDDNKDDQKPDPVPVVPDTKDDDKTDPVVPDKKDDDKTDPKDPDDIKPNDPSKWWEYHENDW